MDTRTDSANVKVSDPAPYVAVLTAMEWLRSGEKSPLKTNDQAERQEERRQ